MMKNVLIPLILLALLGGCTAAPGGGTHDPWETSNREVHDFNKRLDATLFGGSDEDDHDGPGVPEELSSAVVNFADNVGLPGMVVNNLLQANLEGAGQNALRFVVNSTVGLLGLFDPADAAGLTEVEADFAQTLAVWGLGEGAYLELPVLGPSTERDLLGRVVDLFIDPLKHVGTPAQTTLGTPAKLAARIIKRDQYSDTIDSVLRDSADSYAQTRLIYLQNRRFELGEEAAEEVDPYAELFGE